jgi:uncharacterized BrkB/YihY/UPF0761 family membrane protein
MSVVRRSAAAPTTAAVTMKLVSAIAVSSPSLALVGRGVVAAAWTGAPALFACTSCLRGSWGGGRVYLEDSGNDVSEPGPPVETNG